MFAIFNKLTKRPDFANVISLQIVLYTIKCLPLPRIVCSGFVLGLALVAVTRTISAILHFRIFYTARWLPNKDLQMSVLAALDLMLLVVLTAWYGLAFYLASSASGLLGGNGDGSPKLLDPSYGVDALQTALAGMMMVSWILHAHVALRWRVDDLVRMEDQGRGEVLEQ